MKSFAEEFKEIYLDIREIQSEQIIEELLSDKLDIGILATPLNEPYLREIPIFL